MMVTDPVERAVIEAIDIDGLLAFLGDLVAIPSLDGASGEVAAQEYVAAFLERLGCKVDVWEIDFDELRRHPAFSAEVERKRGLGVVGVGGLGNGPTLIFNGHVDVVPAGDESLWRFPPWQATIADGYVYGRGALDMKGGLACAIFAAQAIRDAGVQLRGRLLIQSVIGEEDGGCGTLATVLRGHTGDGAIVVEPTELRIAPAQAGALNFRLMVPGAAAHGCVREEGISAIEKFMPLYRALTDLEAIRNAAARLRDDPISQLYRRYSLPYALCIGVVRAGEWASTVAETLVAEGRYGVAVGEDLEAARRMLEEAVARAAQADPWLREHPPRVEWWGGQFAPASIPADHPLVQTTAAAFADTTNAPAILEGMTYGADMRLLVNEGRTPTILFGPGDVRNAHRPNERIAIADLRIATQTLALTALRFCGIA
ncbi:MULTISPECIES: ArgE/DapE family deacylase [Roseiflexus]|jgi:acetylornithine deacetylase|uniref:Acetylornithine deacetylase or succinyl-diaminopimelate desuccinylase n=1 Tax=Roseiflexus castenholzii (strain DSM 13941 / HLO8) TaxID=383372 RepID=A7NFD6_ROSCS|nr:MULTISPECIES: ArgE/DapE family deacylase [Roseiflexus]ABU56158.1 acetylornithine deacetylase or succinyl-diaminopimelate desuccinylase [Roseiflexus castenholzii DSM 13941]GIV98910.1 MAG: acetylornithine deacetylase [Roseiflexus sp.]